MINSVSFGSQAKVFDKANVSKPQAYVKPEQVYTEEAPKKEKKGTFGKVVLSLVAAAAVATGLLVAGNKTGVLKNLGKYVPEKVKSASWLNFAKEPVKKAAAGLDKAGEYIATKGVEVYEAVKNSNFVERVKGMFKKGTPAA